MGKNQSRLKHITESWKYIQEHCSKEFSEFFYTKLFHDNPSYRYTIFERIEGTEGFANLLLTIINMLLKSAQPTSEKHLANISPTASSGNLTSETSSVPESFRTTVEEVGRRHLHYGVDSTEYFDRYLEALLFSLEKYLPKQMWNSEVSTSWSESFHLVQSLMMQGMKKVIENKKSVASEGDDLLSINSSIRHRHSTLMNKLEELSFDFDKVMQKRQLRNIFIEYCYQRYTTENVKFLLYVENLSQPNLTDVSRWHILYYIWELFLKQNGRLELNLPFDLKQKFMDKFQELRQKKLCTVADLEIVNEIESNVKKTLKANIFFEFCKSDAFIDYCGLCSNKELLALTIDGVPANESDINLLSEKSDLSLHEGEIGGSNKVRESGQASHHYHQLHHRRGLSDTILEDAVGVAVERASKNEGIVEKIAMQFVEKELQDRLPDIIHNLMNDVVDKEWFKQMLQRIIERNLMKTPAASSASSEDDINLALPPSHLVPKK